jgi:hypothetical protein
MRYNHYRKNVQLGPFTNAVARNADGTIKYEVVYSPIIDDLVGQQTGNSVPVSVTLPYPAYVAGQEITTVYPNSLQDMRDRIYAALGQNNLDLPLWMASVQNNGTVLGFIPAWVVCYTLPNYSSGIAYRLNQLYASQLPYVDFDIDRYNLDNVLTYRYNPTSHTWNLPTDVYSNVNFTLNGLLTTTVYANSLVPDLVAGDTIAWSTNAWGNGNINTYYTTTVLDVSPWTPVNLITLTNAGNGYSQVSPPRITVANPPLGGLSAEAQVTVLANGTISDNITILRQGYGYHVPPKVTIAPPPDGNVANTAQATATIIVSPVTSLQLVPGQHGGKYPINKGTANITMQPPSYDSQNPSFNLASSTANGTAYLGIDLTNPANNDIVRFVNLNNQGNNYTSAPQASVETSKRGNTANVFTTINYQILVGNSAPWANSSGNVYLYNQFVEDNELNKYYLFPRVNILE